MTATVIDDPILVRVRREIERIYGDRLHAVLLYGSRARGDAHPDSDYDIAVLINGYNGNLDEVFRLADLGYELMLETDRPLSLKPFSPDEITQRTLFMHNLRQDAIAL
jgi:uncharacterized protein